MTQHPGKFVAESPVPIEKAAAELKPALAAPEPLQAAPSRSRHILRKSLLAAAGVFALAGAGIFRLAVLDGRPVRRLDRRRLCPGGQYDDRAESVGLHFGRAGRRQRARQGGPDPGPYRRPRFPGRAGAGQGRCRLRHGRRSAPSRRPSTRSSRSSTPPAAQSPSTRLISPSRTRTTSAIPPSPPAATGACRTRSRPLRVSPRRTPPSRATRPRSKPRLARFLC